MKVIHQEYEDKGTVEYDLGTMRRVVLRANDGHEIEISDETENGNGFEIKASHNSGSGRLVVCPAYSNSVHVFHEDKFETLHAQMLRMQKEKKKQKKKGD